MKKILRVLSVLISAAVLLAGCGGGGGGGGTPSGGGGTTTTNVSGKVTLSSTVSGAPSSAAAYKLKARAGVSRGKPGSKSFYAAKTAPSTLLGKTLMAASAEVPLDDAWVYLFNADHPEWLYPVAKTTTDASGVYTLTTLVNASKNGNAYTDGASIPAGNYTFLAWKATPGSTKITAVVQAVVSKLTGAVVVDLLDAVQSSTSPKVVTMFGRVKNTDGTQTWGSASATVPANAALQITFNMPMWRDTITNGISISPAVAGKWSLSSDWLTATFYPDSGVTLAQGTAYTVTVKGLGSTNPVTNVFGNTIASNAVGTFTAATTDSAAPTAIVTSPDTSSDVSVVTPIRIASNKLLDVNTLLLTTDSASPGLGAMPGVSYVGESGVGQYKYVYEFVLAEPLQLGKTYNISVSGGKGVNGVTMNAVTYSFTTMTVTAGTTVSGISGTATAATQNTQAAVADVFGKWIRAMNDRNLSQFQGLMSPEFYMEYDASRGISSEDDLNRDGRFSYVEFTNMISNAFTHWNYCGTTIDGTVVGVINVVGDSADFEFKLSGSNTLNDSRCSDAAPNGSMYTTLKNKNGAWIMVRASEGIDTRTRPITFPSVLSLNMYENPITFVTDGTLIADGGTMSGTPPTAEANWKWTADAAVKGSYVLMIVDQRDPHKGVAIALPSSETNFRTDIKDPSFKDVSDEFGFDTGAMGFSFVQGGLYYYEVIGLGSIGVNDIATKTDAVILSDVVAVSSLRSFAIAGTYKVMTATVSAGGSTKTFDERIGGYDVVAAATATISVTTPNTAATMGNVNVSGSGWQSYQLPFTAGQGSVTVNLYQGQNWVCADDGTGSTAPGGGATGTPPLQTCFSIKTTGGIPPVVKVTSVVADNNTTPLTGDQWSYYEAPGAKKVTVSGTVSDANITTLEINLNNEDGAYTHSATIVTGGVFSTTLEIYNGNNWINIGGMSTVTNNWTSAFVGVHTDTGSVYVAPFSNIDVKTATKTGDWGSSQDWDASADTDNAVTVSGKLKVPVNGTFNVWSEGSSAYGDLTVLADGTFSLDVALYNGWNNVNLNDSVGNWYGINIYTTAGKTVVKTTITQFNGATYNGNYNQDSTACQVTMSGTAPVGKLDISWSGYDGSTNRWDQQTLQVTGASASDATGSFAVTVPIVGGSGSYNYIDLYDANFKWTGISVTTSGTCPYIAPMLTVNAVKNSAGTVMTLDTMNNYYDVAGSSSVQIEGASTRAGRTINVDVQSCGKPIHYQTTSALTSFGTDSGTGAALYAWSIANIAVYNNAQTWESNFINISDGPNWQSVNVHTTNGVAPPPPPIQITAVSGATLDTMNPSMCGSTNWNAGTSTTVTISGTTSAKDGTSNYTDASGTSHQFTITNGAFSITSDVFNGWNNININDTEYNYMNVGISTTNTVPKPKFMEITSPASNAVNLSGLQTVSGVIAPPAGTTFEPSNIYAYASVGVYDTSTMMCDWTYVNYSSDVYSQVNYGDKPVTFDPVAKTFSFTVDFGAGPGNDATYGNICSSSINVNAWDSTNYSSHGYSMSVNTSTNWTSQPYWYKPGSRPKTASDNNVVKAEFLRQFMRRIMP